MLSFCSAFSCTFGWDDWLRYSSLMDLIEHYIGAGELLDDSQAVLDDYIPSFVFYGVFVLVVRTVFCRYSDGENDTEVVDFGD